MCLFYENDFNCTKSIAGNSVSSNEFVQSKFDTMRFSTILVTNKIYIFPTLHYTTTEDNVLISSSFLLLVRANLGQVTHEVKPSFRVKPIPKNGLLLFGSSLCWGQCIFFFFSSFIRSHTHTHTYTYIHILENIVKTGCVQVDSDKQLTTEVRKM